MTTPAEKDAMALDQMRVASKHLRIPGTEGLPAGPKTADNLDTARAQLSERLYLMGGEVARFKQVADSLSEQVARMEDCINHERARATRAEAELAAVIKAADYFARNFTGKNSDKLRVAIDAARGAG